MPVVVTLDVNGPLADVDSVTQLGLAVAVQLALFVTVTVDDCAAGLLPPDTAVKLRLGGASAIVEAGGAVPDGVCPKTGV